MSKAGPVKHCHCCNKAMMKQVMKCQFCGVSQYEKAKRQPKYCEEVIVSDRFSIMTQMTYR